MTTRAHVMLELRRPRQKGEAVLTQLAAEAQANGPQLRVERMDERQLQDAMASDRYVCHAPTMPLQLLAPLAADASIDPVDNTLGCTWGIAATGAAASTFRGDGTSIAILDTGIDLDHPAFAAMRDRITVQDFTDSGAGDADGHGTHTAGTAFGQDVDGVRIGVAPNVRRALVGRVFDDFGNAPSEGLFKAMSWAIHEGAQVIAISLGIDFPGALDLQIASGLPARKAAARVLVDFLANVRMFDTMVALARTMIPFTGGSLIVGAAGNESEPALRMPVSVPANAEGVLSVGAVGPSPEGWRIAPFSNTGPSLCGPGMNVLSANLRRDAADPALKALDGTSTAAPHIAGIAALWYQALHTRNERAIYSNVYSHLLANALGATRFAPNTSLNDRGVGFVQAP